MAGPDSFYTPQPLADRLVSFVTERNIKTAIDFCVGDGDLLKAVQNQFGNVRFFGTDISKDAIVNLANNHVDWILDVCDFRDDNSIAKVSFLKNAKFDLIMFNPPFTCKGSIIERITFKGIEYKVSTAMMFVIKALQYLSSTGGMYAILPISCVYSQKDKKAWNYLQTNYNACVLEEPKRVYFCNRCSPNIALVYIGHQSKKISSTKKNEKFFNFNVKSVVRGSIRMQKLTYSNSKKAPRLIHTTNIQKGKLVNLKRILAGDKITIDGYGVVIPRVCNPNPHKIAILDGRYTYILSDCVIALLTPTIEAAEQIRIHILNNWSLFVDIYRGTGAQYTTIERVKTLFGKQ